MRRVGRAKLKKICSCKGKVNEKKKFLAAPTFGGGGGGKVN